MKKNIVFFLIAGISGAIAAASFSFGLFTGLEFFFEDVLVSAKPFNTDIVIVAIDNESLAKIGQWPWPRKIFAQGLKAMNAYPPRAVGFDVMLSEASRQGVEDDALLDRALDAALYPIVMPYEASPLIHEDLGYYQARIAVEPKETFLRHKQVTRGHVNLIQDQDGVVRNFPLSIRAGDAQGGEKINAFALALGEISGLLRSSDPRTVEKSELPENQMLRIVYAAPPGAIRRIPFWRILENEDASALRALEKKIVLIGAIAPDLHDEKLTPFSRGSEMPGVEIQAHITNMLLSGYRLKPLNQLWMALWLMIAALIPAFFFAKFSVWRAPIFSVGIGVLHFIGVVVLFEQGIAVNFVHVQFAWIGSAIALVLYRYFIGEKERRMLTHVFSKYVSDAVLKEILKNPQKVTLGGEEREVTVFFSDIRGFTTISEKTTPKELVRMLNRYFTEMTEEVLASGGVLDKYIGDAIMAFWGAPIDDSNQADNALKASLAMLKKLKALNQELKKVGDPEINIGIGLYTGTVIVGNIGSEKRFDYTIIGDTVNVASRLESLNKEYHTQLILGDATVKKLKKKIPLRELGSVSVKGRKEQITIYTLEENAE